MRRLGRRSRRRLGGGSVMGLGGAGLWAGVTGCFECHVIIQTGRGTE